MKNYVSIEQLLESGAHFGHLTRRWNPKMEPFIFTEKNGIHIIDLRKTQVLINIARKAVFDISQRGRNILYVGTKDQAKDIIEEEAGRADTNYVSERWLGGMLTNFATIRKSIKRLAEIDKMEVDGTFDKITKKERLLKTRERDKLRRMFGGIETMTRLPGALFVVDIKKEHLAIKEAKILDIPVIALVDTNTDPELVDYPIPCNDDSVNTIRLILKVMTDAINEGGEIAKVKKAELSAEHDRIAKETDKTEEQDDAKVQRKLRERRPRRQRTGNNENKKSESKPDNAEKNKESSNEEEKK